MLYNTKQDPSDDDNVENYKFSTWLVNGRFLYFNALKYRIFLQFRSYFEIQFFQ